MAKLHIAFFEHASGIFEKTVIACHIGRIEFGDLGIERVFIVGIIEIRAIGPVEPVKRHDLHQLDIIFEPVAGQIPQLAQAIRIGDNGRPAIKDKAVLLPVIRPAARLVARFDHGCGNAR